MRYKDTHQTRKRPWNKYLLNYILYNMNSTIAGPKPGYKRRRVVHRVSTPTMWQKYFSYRNLDYNTTKDGFSESTRGRANEVEKTTDKASLTLDYYTDCDMERADYVQYFGIFWPWLIIGLIRHLYEKAKNKHTKISLNRNFPQVMQTQHIPIPVCLILICVFSHVVTGVGCILL